MTLPLWNFGKKTWTKPLVPAKQIYLMSSALSVWKRFAFSGLFAGIASAICAESAYQPQGSEYPMAGLLPGDQVFPQVALNTSGGYLVWQDNVTDGDALGISARRINGSLSGTLGVFRVNEQGAGDQQKPKVALLKNGGAVFVWQGGTTAPHIYARFLKPDGTFATGDVLVNTYSQNHQVDPAVASLADGNVVVVWSSFGQDGDLYGVFAQRFSSAGTKMGPEFQVNQFTQNNQRSAVVAGFAGGGFLVAWISEQFKGSAFNTDASGLPAPDGSSGLLIYDVDVHVRRYDATGESIADEFKANSMANLCANPVVSVTSDDGFLLAWSGKPNQVTIASAPPSDGWDIFGRVFGSDGNPKVSDFRINTYTYGDQFRPQVASLGQSHFVVWTSLQQDGSREGVYGQVRSSSGGEIGSEFRVNTITASQQIFPTVASDGDRRFLAVWSRFVGGMASFDLFAQRYAADQALPVPSAPYVSALSQSRLSVTWPELEGFNVDHYELYVDSNANPVSVTNNLWTATGLISGSTHSFRLAYWLTDGRSSAPSAPSSGTTWSEDENLDGLPDDWQVQYWGPNTANWPSPQTDSDGDGASNLQEFLAGTDPTEPNSVLRVQLVSTAQGAQLRWNSQPGFMYQVQVSQTLGAGSWSSVGTARFAAGAADSTLLNGTSSAAYYRVIRLR
jgi:hypothetical protein